MKKNDIILIASILIIALLAFGIMLLTRSSGAQVVVSVDGQEVKRFDLNQDTTYTIEGIDGGTNDLVIKDGQAYLSDADCPDELCVGMGKISYDGQTIVCLPHKVVIEIEGNEKSSQSDSDLDAIAQ